MPHSLPQSRAAARPALATFRALVAGSAARVKSLLTAVSNRLSVQSLDDLPDHHLADIGLTRADLHAGLNLPLERDPSLELARRARLNRFRARN